MKESKAWGEVEHVFHSKEFAVSYLKTKPKTFCSVHRHIHRHNQFTVVAGELVVVIFDGVASPGAMMKETVLRAGQSLVVPPLVWHQFISHTFATVIELYWTGSNVFVDLNDIDRHSLGGKYD